MKIIKTHCLLGEGVSLLKNQKRIICFDILGRSAFLISPDDGWSYSKITLPFNGSCATEINDMITLIAGNHSIYSTKDFISFDILLRHHFPKDVRMNDGREDPFGRFWYSSMSEDGSRPVGAIFCYDSKVRASKQIFRGLYIPNSICFDPKKRCGYFSDSHLGRIWSFDYTQDCPQIDCFIDFPDKNSTPDGAFVDDHGNVWVAEWGGGQVAKYSCDGQLIKTITLPVSQVTCPIVYKDHLIVTSARVGLDSEALKNEPNAGDTFIIKI